MPVVAGVGGNGAIQTATVIIRAIALGELEFSSAWKAIVKQVLVNICIALAAGGLIAVAGGIWKGNPAFGAVLACALIFNLGLMAGFAGAVIPLLLKALKFDPALGSGIIVTASPRFRLFVVSRARDNVSQLLGIMNNLGRRRWPRLPL